MEQPPPLAVINRQGWLAPPASSGLRCMIVPWASQRSESSDVAMWRRLISPSDPHHEIAAGGLHHAGRFGSVGVAVAGGSGVDRHPQPFPAAARRPFRLQDPGGGAVIARVPHPKGGIFILEHPRTPRPEAVVNCLLPEASLKDVISEERRALPRSEE